MAGAKPDEAIVGVAFPPCAFTKWLSACEWQSILPTGWWQQPCPGWWLASAVNICGQDRQFPKNSAAMISAAMRMLEVRRILTLA